jgi:hypothetical protein
MSFVATARSDGKRLVTVSDRVNALRTLGFTATGLSFVHLASTQRAKAFGQTVNDGITQINLPPPGNTVCDSIFAALKGLRLG